MHNNADTQLLLAGLFSGVLVGMLAALLWRERAAAAPALSPARGLTLSLPAADGIERARQQATAAVAQVRATNDPDGR
jgi:hypothetical protein